MEGRDAVQLDADPMTAQILQGDALSVLRTLPAESLHCVVTSPPFYGLRNYNTKPQIWDAAEGCEHDWETDRYYREGGNSRASGDAFHEAEPENAARLKETRWREN